jgi:hypothetical protein
MIVGGTTWAQAGADGTRIAAGTAKAYTPEGTGR